MDAELLREISEPLRETGKRGGVVLQLGDQGLGWAALDKSLECLDV